MPISFSVSWTNPGANSVLVDDCIVPLSSRGDSALVHLAKSMKIGMVALCSLFESKVDVKVRPKQIVLLIRSSVMMQPRDQISYPLLCLVLKVWLSKVRAASGPSSSVVLKDSGLASCFAKDVQNSHRLAKLRRRERESAWHRRGRGLDRNKTVVVQS